MRQPDTVWIVDDDRSIRWVLDRALSGEGFETRCFESGDQLLDELTHGCPEAIISDIRMPGIDGLALLERIHEDHAKLPVVIMTAHSDLESTVNSYQRGAFDYLPKPFDLDDALTVVRRAVAHAHEQRGTDPDDDYEFDEAPAEIIGRSPAMQEVFRAIGRLSKSNITVLINGESGTGKELVARALHRHSPRAGAPFIALNMAAIPAELTESELFGHEKGAFTGATQQRIGRFEQADGGTLFLDEIGDMPAETQTRLLRVLADGEFYRVGGHAPLRADVRIIAATHQNLEQLVSEGRFRDDLFHRLNVIRVHIPRLSERPEDIALLAQHFLNTSAQELGGEPKLLTPDAEEFLSRLEWPGNVRQLENTCRWLTVMASGREVHVEDMPTELRSTGQPAARVSAWDQALLRWGEQQLASRSEGDPPLLATAMPMFERTVIDLALRHTGGRKRDAAELLGWGRNTLTRKLKELNFNDRYDDSGDD